MDTGLLELASRLVSEKERDGAAAALALHFGAESLFIFLRDPEVKQMLPAPGFPQTLPDGKAWRALAESCVPSHQRVRDVRVRAGGELRPAIALGGGNDVALILVGIDQRPAGIEWFLAVMPMIATALTAERTAALAQAKARMASETAARAATLSQALDRTRGELELALHEAREAREELEAQAIEMEAQTEQLLEANANLEQARTASENASRAKSQFVATVSHELRTPLNAISGHVQLMELELHGPITEAQRTALARIDRNQKHLLGLINDILNLSRIESGKIDYQITDVELKDVVAEIAPMIEPQMQAKGLEYDAHQTDRPFVIRADREKLEQILLNLLSNAVKFTNPGGRVWIECHQHDGHGIVQVCDSGLGIPPGKLETIFEPFTQVDASHSRVGHGVGLGLSISRDLARGMGGELSVQSALGKGSIFSLSLVATLPSAVDTDTPPSRAAHAQWTISSE